MTIFMIFLITANLSYSQGLTCVSLFQRNFSKEFSDKVDFLDHFIDSHEKNYDRTHELIKSAKTNFEYNSELINWADLNNESLNLMVNLILAQDKFSKPVELDKLSEYQNRLYSLFLNQNLLQEEISFIVSAKINLLKAQSAISNKLLDREEIGFVRNLKSKKLPFGYYPTIYVVSPQKELNSRKHNSKYFHFGFVRKNHTKAKVKSLNSIGFLQESTNQNDIKPLSTIGFIQSSTETITVDRKLPSIGFLDANIQKDVSYRGKLYFDIENAAFSVKFDENRIGF